MINTTDSLNKEFDETFVAKDSHNTFKPYFTSELRDKIKAFIEKHYVPRK